MPTSPLPLQATEPSPAPLAALHGGRRNRFFVWIAVAMLLVVALGFGPSFYLRPWGTGQPLPVYLIVHGLTLSAWYLLFLAQAVLVSAGRRDLHGRLGIAGVALAAGVVVTGAMAHLNFIAHLQAQGLLSGPEDRMRAGGFVLEGLISLLPFVVLIVLAVVLRRRTQLHKRLMYWAFVWTLGPALTATRPLGAMLDSLVAPHLPFFPADLIWLVALLAYDWKTQGRIHPATYVGFALLAFYFFFVTRWLAGIEALQRLLMAQV